jgi:hypothetical protein
MNLDLIPGLDPHGLPGPPWLFQSLLVLTFFFHMIFVNLTLGGSLLAAVSHIAGGGGGGDHRLLLARRLASMNTFAIALAITTGIAPLLFVQVLYQQYFYTATILLGWIWFSLLGLLVLGYYAAYLFKLRSAPAPGQGGGGWLVLAAAAFLLIACLQVAVYLIQAQPGQWTRFAEAPLAVLSDRTFWPRLAHFVLAALAFAAVSMTWWAVRRARAGDDVEGNRRVAAYAWRWALWTTALVLVDGFILLALLPRPVLLALMRGGAATMVPLTLAIVLAVGLVMMLARASDPVQSPGLVSGVAATAVLVIAVMTIVRDQVRVVYLQPATSHFTWQTAPQWFNTALFALLLIAGLATIAYVVRRVLGAPASGPEAA